MIKLEDSYIDSAYEESQIVKFKNEILQTLQGDIKKLLDSEFTFFKSRCEDLVVKSSATLNSQIKHLQEVLRSKDEKINQSLTVLNNITNTELQSKNDVVNKLIDASIASNRNSAKTGINILEHEKKTNNKNENNNEKSYTELSNNAVKNHVNNMKINYSQKRPSGMMKTFIKYSRRKPE